MKKLRILCIDDSKSVHSFLKICVMDKAQSFDSAFNGEEGIQLIKSKSKDIDVIFLDWEMPIKDGPTTFEEFKKLNLNVPVFMLTSKNNPEDILRMLNLGVTDYLMKPFTKDIIVEKLESVFS